MLVAGLGVTGFRVTGSKVKMVSQSAAGMSTNFTWSRRFKAEHVMVGCWHCLRL